MKLFFILLIAFILFGCNSNNELLEKPEFTMADSTAMVKVIMDSLRSEYESQWFMKTEKMTSTCGYFGFRPALNVFINKGNRILIRDGFDAKNISESVALYYTKNMYENDLMSNEPLYSRVKKNEILNYLDDLEKQIKSLKDENGFEDIIFYREEERKEWEQRLTILNLTREKNVREPSLSAGINLRYQTEKMNEKIMDSLLLGYYIVREIDANDYFKESYAKICWKALKLGDTNAIKKMGTFKILHPVRIFDEIRFNHLMPPPTPPPAPPIRILDPVKLPIDIIVPDSIEIVPNIYSD